MIATIYTNIYIEGQDVYKKLKNGTFHKISKWIDNVGYYQVVFRVAGRRKYIRLHRLIMTTLFPNADHSLQINHKDGNKLNNDITNLEWCTNTYNTQAGYDAGLYTSTYRCGVRAIHKLTGAIFEFDSIRSCAAGLGLNRKTITSILKQSKQNNYPYYFEYL